MEAVSAVAEVVRSFELLLPLADRDDELLDSDDEFVVDEEEVERDDRGGDDVTAAVTVATVPAMQQGGMLAFLSTERIECSAWICDDISSICDCISFIVLRCRFTVLCKRSQERRSITRAFTVRRCFITFFRRYLIMV